MKKILTAKELIDKIDEDFYAKHSFYLSVSSPVLFAETLAIEFAKLHVTAALKEASEKINLTDEVCEALQNHWFKEYIDKGSILNSYPLDKIK